MPKSKADKTYMFKDVELQKRYRAMMDAEWECAEWSSDNEETWDEVYTASKKADRHFFAYLRDNYDVEVDTV